METEKVDVNYLGGEGKKEERKREERGGGRRGEEGKRDGEN